MAPYTGTLSYRTLYTQYTPIARSTLPRIRGTELAIILRNFPHLRLPHSPDSAALFFFLSLSLGDVDQ